MAIIKKKYKGHFLGTSQVLMCSGKEDMANFLYCG
jgi:hypothetical protein